MTNKIHLSQIFSPLLTPKEKGDLFAAYRDYIFLCKNFEELVKSTTPSLLAYSYIDDLFAPRKRGEIWSIKKIKNEEKQNFDDFLANKNAPDDICFITMDYISRNKDTNYKKIVYIPDEYALYSTVNHYPDRVEQFTIAYPKDKKLSEVTFIVDGRFRVEYIYSDKDRPVSDIDTDQQLIKRFRCLLNALSQVNENQIETPEEMNAAQIEALVSELLSPLENALTGSLTNIAEESNNILKKLLAKRYNKDYLYQAEQQGLIDASIRFQDYINIRQFIAHRWEANEREGHVTEQQKEKNATIYTRYKDSYNRLYNKKLLGRLNNYIQAGKDFSTLITALFPNVLRREENESNSKFITRIKQYVKDNPTKEIFIEMNYSGKKEKREALQKSIAKLFPTAEILDKTDVTDFSELAMPYIIRQKYIESFQQIEHNLKTFGLINGKTLSPIGNWQLALSQGILTEEEFEKWKEYHQLRNSLSHNHLDKNLEKRVTAVINEFLDQVEMVSRRLQAAVPPIVHIRDNIYEARHPNGKVVTIDFVNNRILEITTPMGNTVTKKEWEEKTKGRQYTEEYPTGLRITVQGNKIISCQFPNKLEINFFKKKIYYPQITVDYTKENENTTYITSHIKITTDKQFHLKNCLIDGKSINLTATEKANLSPNYQLKLNKNGQLASETFINQAQEKVQLTYMSEENPPKIKLDNGVIISFTPQGIEISHNNIALTYATRKTFAESFAPPPNILLAMKQGKIK